MPKDIRSGVIVEAQTKGFETAQQKVAKFNAEANQGVAAQAKGFAETEKSSASLDKALERLKKNFTGSASEFKKQIQAVTKEFNTLDRIDFKDVQKQIGGLQEELVGLNKEQAAVTSVMGGMADKSSDAYGKLENHLKDITSEARTTERQISSLTGAFAKQSKEVQKLADIDKRRRGAFVQGLAQGGLPFPAPFVQRGPGMGRQVAGMAIGRGVMGGIRGGRAVGGAAFGGVQGMARGLGALPLVGGALAGQFSAAAQYAQQNIQWQKTKLEQAPYMEGVGDIRERHAYLSKRSAKFKKALAVRKEARSAVEQAAEESQYIKQAMRDKERAKRDDIALGEAGKKGVVAFTKEEFSQGIAKHQREYAKFKNPLTSGFKTAMEGGISGMLSGATMEELIVGGLERGIAEAKVTRKKGKILPIEELTKNLEKSQARLEASEIKSVKADKDLARVEKGASKKYGVDPFRDVTKLGLSLLGVSKPEAAQAAGSIIRAGGGRKAEAQGQGMIAAGFAAKSAYDIDYGTSGAFLSGGRRGGLAGARGQADEAFKKTLAEGLQMVRIQFWMIK